MCTQHHAKKIYRSVQRSYAVRRDRSCYVTGSYRSGIFIIVWTRIIHLINVCKQWIAFSWFGELNTRKTQPHHNEVRGGGSFTIHVVGTIRLVACTETYAESFKLTPRATWIIHAEGTVEDSTRSPCIPTRKQQHNRDPLNRVTDCG